MSLLAITLALGALSFCLSYRLTKNLYNPSTWYWTGWALGLLGHVFCVAIRDMDPLSESTEAMTLNLHCGAFFGFLGADVLHSRRQEWRAPTNQEHFVPGFLWAILLLTTVFGVWALADAVSLVGWDVASLRRNNLEQTYRQPTLPIGLRINAYAAIAASPIVPLLALSHVEAAVVRLKTVLLVVLSTLPGMLASGGRGAILTVLPPYIVLALAWSPRGDIGRSFRRQLRRTIMACVLIVGTVTVGIDQLRSGAASERVALIDKSSPLNLGYPIASYLAVPIAAMDAYTEFASNHYDAQALLGQTFPFFNKQLSRLGLTASGDDFYGDSRDYVASTEEYSRYGTTHATVVPCIVADFGCENLLVVSLVLALLFETVALRAAGHGLVGASLTLWACWDGAGNLASSNMFGCPRPILGVLVAVAVAPFCKRRRRHNGGNIDCRPELAGTDREKNVRHQWT